MNRINHIIEIFNAIKPEEDGITKIKNILLITENGELHSENGPSISFLDGDCIFTKHGEMHREDGPALIMEEYSLWVLNDIEYDFDDWCEKLDKSPKEKAMMLLQFF